MLTQTEMTHARDTLRQAQGMVSSVHTAFFSAGYVQGARFLKAVLVLLEDEIAALEKALAAPAP